MSNNFSISKLPLLNLVNDYTNARLQVRGLKAIFEEMETHWTGAVDKNIGIHLIKGVELSTIKTDACRVYASELTIRLKNMHGFTLQGWCNVSKARFSTDNEGGLAKIGLGKYKEHQDLFVWVLSNIFSVDPLLCRYAVASDEKESNEVLMTWLFSRCDELTNDTSGVRELYSQTIHYHEMLTDAELPLLMTECLGFCLDDSVKVTDTLEEYFNQFCVNVLNERVE